MRVRYEKSMSVTRVILVDIYVFDFSTACTANSSKKTLSAQEVQVLNCISRETAENRRRQRRRERERCAARVNRSGILQVWDFASITEERRDGTLAKPATKRSLVRACSRILQGWRCGRPLGENIRMCWNW